MALKAKYGQDFNFDVMEAFKKKKAKNFLNNLRNPKIVWNKVLSQTIDTLTDLKDKKDDENLNVER